MAFYLDFIEVDQPVLWFLLDPTERPLQSRSPATQGKDLIISKLRQGYSAPPHNLPPPQPSPDRQ